MYINRLEINESFLIECALIYGMSKANPF